MRVNVASSIGAVSVLGPTNRAQNEFTILSDSAPTNFLLLANALAADDQALNATVTFTELANRCTSTTMSVRVEKSEPELSLDKSLNKKGHRMGSGVDQPVDMKLGPDGSVYVLGYSNGTPRTQLAKFSSETLLLDENFGMGGVASASFSQFDEKPSTFIFDRQGRPVVVGTLTSSQSIDPFVVRFTTAGKLDPSFSDDGLLTFDLGRNRNETGRTIVAQSGGSLVMVGDDNFDHETKGTAVYSLRLNENGARDLSWHCSQGSGCGLSRFHVSTLDGTDAVDTARNSVLGPDDKVTISGVQAVLSTRHIPFVAQLERDGALVTNFAPPSGVKPFFVNGTTIKEMPVPMILNSLGGFLLGLWRPNAPSDGQYWFSIGAMRFSGMLEDGFGDEGYAIHPNGTVNEFSSSIAQAPGGEIYQSGAHWIGTWDTRLIKWTKTGEFKALADFSQSAEPENGLRVAVANSGKVVVLHTVNLFGGPIVTEWRFVQFWP